MPPRPDMLRAGFAPWAQPGERCGLPRCQSSGKSWASGEKDKDPTLGKIKSLGPVKTYYSTIMYHRTIVLGRNNLNNDDHQFTM